MARQQVGIIWTEPALDDLQAITDWIANDKPAAAALVAQRVFAAVERLELFPESGRWVPESPEHQHREAIMPPCRIMYRATPTAVYIV
jgi:toxin ParE1/3/4